MLVLRILILLMLGIALPVSAAINVTTRDVTDIVIYPAHDVPANVLSLNDSVLSAEISGRVLEIPHRVGAQVKKGDILLRFECDDYQAQLLRSEADLKALQAAERLSKWQLERAKSLSKTNNMSEEMLQTRETESLRSSADLQRGQATLRTARKNVERCQLRSPFDGVITERMVSVGALAAPGTPLIRVIDQATLELSAQLHNNAVDQLPFARKMQFRAFNRFYPVQLRAMIPALDAKTRTQEVRLEFLEKKPLPGTAGRLIWEDRRPHIPANYLRAHKNQLGIFVVDAQRARLVPLAEAFEGRPAPVPPGFTGKIIESGRNAVAHGIEVNVKGR